MDSLNTTQRMKLYNPSTLAQIPKIPLAFKWPSQDLTAAVNRLQLPTVDLAGILAGENSAAGLAAAEIGTACRDNGIFQVVNHGVDGEVYDGGINGVKELFELPFGRKLEAGQKKGEIEGYALGHSDRFAVRLPWKETFTFVHGFKRGGDEGAVTGFFCSALGPDFEPTGKIYQRYCEEMEKLSVLIAELIGMSLGVKQEWSREFFEDGKAIARCNYYPPCKQAELTLGTGPHADPNAFTILQQDEVSGLQVFAAGQWRFVRAVAGALIVNIGDTFEALSNGEYKSCIHRAVVNPYKERRSIAYFVSPKNDKIIRPPPELLAGKNGDGVRRRYPDFTWSQLLEFTQTRHRVEGKTLASFIEFLDSSDAVM